MATQTNRIDLNDYFDQTKSDVPGVVGTTQKSTKDDIRDMLSYAVPATTTAVGDPYMKGKEQVFGADLNHHKFERYYNHPNFKKLGFNPYLDNEAIYNANSGFTDDFRRSYSQWKTLAAAGFKDAASFGPSSDRNFAKEYERAFAIGTSNLGGASGFVNNLFLNSGYTVGIMGEIIAEEAALALGTLATGGALGEFAAVRTMQNAAKFTKGLFSAEEWAKKANKITKGLDALEDVFTAKNVFQGLKTGTIGAGKFIGKNLVPESYQFLSNFDKLENLSGIAKTAKGFGSFYRDVRNMRLAYGESALEAGMIENDMVSELYNDFVAKNGRDPNDAEAAKIRNTAKAAGLTTAWTNMPVIYFSNNIVLGSMFKSFSPMRRFIPMEEGRFARTMLTKKGFEVIEKSFKNSLKGLVKPKTYGRFALDYLSANLAEGLQESAQEIISGTNKMYYKNLYNNSSRGGYYDSLSKNVSLQFSPEGLEVFASGFLMGGLISPVSGAIGAVTEKATSIFDKNYAADKAAALKAQKQRAAELTEFYNDPTKYNDLQLNNMVEQEAYANKMMDAEESGNQKLFQDSKSKSLTNQLYTVFESDQVDTFKQRFESLKKLDDEALLEALPTATNATEARKQLDDMSSKMDSFKKTYDFVKKNLPNEFNPGNYKPGTEEHQLEAIAYVSFREAQKDLIFAKQGTTEALRRMGSIMSEATQDLGVAKLLATDITNTFSLGALNNEIATLQQEIKVFGEQELVTAEAKKLKADKESKLNDLIALEESIKALVSEIEPTEQEVNKAIGSDSGEVVFTKENFIKESVYTAAKKAYTKYVKNLAKGEMVTDKNVDTAFEKLIDYYLLDSDAKRYNETVNTLMNPASFYEYAARKKEVIETEYNDRQTRIEEALAQYKAKMHQNELLQELYKNDMFFDPEEWEALQTEGKMPRRIYNSTGKKEQILTTSAQYNKAVDIIRQYVENVLDIPLDYNKQLDAYNTDTRDKLPGDERTYEDLAEQFGFDPKATRSTVPLRDVLNAIINSEYATEQEQALARRLLKLATADETVTFAKDLAGPGIYTQAEQTVIDARYSGSEYAFTPQSYPLEVSILREEVNRRLFNATKTDAQFKTDIENIRQAAIAYYDQNKMFMEGFPLALSSADEFIKATMTSDSFREFLSQIEYPETQKSGWAEFVDKVVGWLNRVFGLDTSGSALNAAIAVITNKIDESYKKGYAGATTSTKGTAGPSLMEMSIPELRATKPELVDALIESYKDYNSNLIATPELMSDPDYASKTDEEIENSPQFEEFAKNMNLPRVAAIYEKYKSPVKQIKRKSGAREVLPGIPESQSNIEDLVISQEVKDALYELGYTDEEINEWTPYIAINVAIFGESKDETQRRLEELEEEAEEKDAARQEFNDLIDSIKDYNRFKEVDNYIIENFAHFTTVGEISVKEIEEALNNKKAELAFETKFDDLNVDDTVVIDNLEKGIQGIWTVQNKTKNKLTLVNVNDATKTFTITRKQFEAENKNRLIFKYTPNLEDMQLSSNPISEEEQEISNLDVNGITSLTDEEIENAIMQGKKMDPEDALNNLLDSLEDIC